MYSLFPCRFNFVLFFFLDVIIILVRLKEITVPLLFFFSFLLCFSSASTETFQHRSEVNVVFRILEPLRLWEPQLAFCPSACLPCGDDGWTWAACRCGVWRPGASNPPSYWSARRRLEENPAGRSGAKGWRWQQCKTRRPDCITNDRCKHIINWTWHYCLCGRRISSRCGVSEPAARALGHFTVCQFTLGENIRLDEGLVWPLVMRSASSILQINMFLTHRGITLTFSQLTKGQTRGFLLPAGSYCQVSSKVSPDWSPGRF